MQQSTKKILLSDKFLVSMRCFVMKKAKKGGVGTQKYAEIRGKEDEGVVLLKEIPRN